MAATVTAGLLLLWLQPALGNRRRQPLVLGALYLRCPVGRPLVVDLWCLGKPGVAGRVRWWPLAVAVHRKLGLLASMLLMQGAANTDRHADFEPPGASCSMLIAVGLAAAVRGCRPHRVSAPVRLRFTGASARPVRRCDSRAGLRTLPPELSPTFLVVWYSLGMLIPTAVGAALGECLLRW